MRENYAANRKRFIQARAADQAAEIEQARMLAFDLREQREKLEQEFARACRFAHVREESLTQGQEEEGFAREWQQILAHRKVRKATIGPNQLCVFTRMLTCRNRTAGATHEIGEFVIVVDLDGGGVRWINATRRVDGLAPEMNAPRVYADGTPVQAEVVQTMSELTARFELSVVVDLAIQFVETATQDAAGATLDAWPLVTEQA